MGQCWLHKQFMATSKKILLGLCAFIISPMTLIFSVTLQMLTAVKNKEGTFELLPFTARDLQVIN